MKWPTVVGLILVIACAAGCDRKGSSPAAADTPSAAPVSPSQPAAETHLRGLVTDRAGRRLRSADVTVIDGPLAGTTVVTDEAGRFELKGMAQGIVTLRAAHDGFEPKAQALTWQPASSPREIDAILWLESVEPPVRLDPGEYTLTVSIDLSTATGHPNIPQAPCAGFPGDLASRTYRATISETAYPDSQYNRSLTVAAPTGVYGGTAFSIAGRFVGFEMDDGIYNDLPEFRFLKIGGTAPSAAPAVDNGASISIPFLGEFRYCRLKSARGIYNDCSQMPSELIVDYHSCASDHVTMLFTRK
jgi:hypothetical protein